MKSDIFPSEPPFYPFRGDLKATQQLSKSRHTIYLAFCPQNKRKYAMKTYNYNDNQIHTSYLQESRIRFLKHPNLLPILDSQDRKRDQHDNFFSYNLMEYAPYGTLSELFIQSEAHKDLKLVRTIFRQVVQGIEYLHSKGVSHLDIKPSNLLISDNYVVKIADFEFSFCEGDLKIAGRGTSGYRAPELKKGFCPHPKSADVFSLGVLLFVMCTRMQPYLEVCDVKGYDLEEMFLSQDASYWKTIGTFSEDGELKDKELRELIWSMTKKNFEDRVTVEDLKKNKWFDGAVYEESEYKEIMKMYLQD